jgi:hypothetical protein
MNAAETRTMELPASSAVGCVLAVVALLGGAPAFAQARADATAAPGAAEALAVIRQNAPAIARAIAADRDLRGVVGPDKWPLALQRLADFTKHPNPDCKDALGIVADTVTRAKSPVSKIKLDGDPSEWSTSMPGAEFVRPERGARNKLWAHGAAGVVRQDRLYLLVGLADGAQYFAQSVNELRVTIDCQGDQTWDVALALSMHNGAWTVKQMPVGFNGQPLKTLPEPQGSIGSVTEIAIATSDFVSASDAKSIWTLLLEAMSTDAQGRHRYLSTAEFPIFNENAREGVAAWPYLQTFVCLCADEPLDGFELTAAAIAIMSSSTYANSDDEVRKRIRMDNAAFLEFARELDAWQTQVKTQYRLRSYPLEAQLAWATRMGEEYGFVAKDREPGRKNDLEDYDWASTSVETLKKLKAVGIQDGLADTDLTVCCERLEEWVKTKQEVSFSPESYLESNKGETDAKKIQANNDWAARAKRLQDKAGIVGYRRGKPVSVFDPQDTESMLSQIDKNGRFVTTCGGHTMVTRDLMRALGIASLRFGVESSRTALGDHVWPARYDPSRNLWLSYQSGRNDRQWWYFYLRRGPVFSYAAEARRFPMFRTNQGPRPFPLVFCRELQGLEVKKTAQAGILTKEVREWMLAPCF